MTATISQFEHARSRAVARRIPISGASIGDIAKTMKEVDNLTTLYLSAVKAHTDKLVENLPVGHGVDINEFCDWVTDRVGDMINGPLTRVHSAKEDGWE